ncbi:hypothetical protein ZWY2020_030303 [Hordeum vulgare]|nr:hypothetical protein ZWY2020_030303 [Hordeum vulgare]
MSTEEEAAAHAAGRGLGPAGQRQGAARRVVGERRRGATSAGGSTTRACVRARRSSSGTRTRTTRAAVRESQFDEDGIARQRLRLRRVSRTPPTSPRCTGGSDVAECLRRRAGADVNALDRWQNTRVKRHAMIDLFKKHGGLTSVSCHSLGYFEAKSIPPPLTNKADWEINPLELDFTKAVMIGKVRLFGETESKLMRTPIAVKFILPSLSDDRLVIFKHEVNLLIKLRHPNIVQFLGQNILLVNTAANHLKVGDFGLSKIIKSQHANDVYKMTGETGSYRYMAPEVFKHRKYDKKVDIFSFAMILYEMLEGMHLFQL